MFSDDHLIIGNQISNSLNMPKINEYYKTKEVFNFSTFTLINHDMPCSFEEFETRWNNDKKQIEGFLTIKDNKNITISNRELVFEKNEEIRLFISKKYIEESIVEAINNAGFRIDLFTTNKKKDYCLVSVSPSRYRS